jgi:hypothetical protein
MALFYTGSMIMGLNWARVFNRLFELINLNGETYYSGSRFITAVRETDLYFPDYGQFLEQRRASGKSTSRKVYFYDILMSFPEEGRARIIHSILDTIKDTLPQKAAEIRDELGGVAAVPTAQNY